MANEKIPVYDICSLKKEQHGYDDFTIERFAAYLQKHYQNLHKAHRHSFYHLVLFTGGKGTHCIDFTTFDVKAGQVYFMAPGQVHSWHFKGAVDGYIVNFSDALFRAFLLNPGYVEQFIFFDGVSKDGVIQLPPDAYKKAMELFGEMLGCFDKKGNRALDMVRLLLLQLFITVDGSRPAGAQEKLPQQKQRLIVNLRRLIDEHYRNLRLPKEYADLLYVTPNHLNALCKDAVGKTAGELIRDRILLEAKRLLTNANMSVTDIAYELNFKDNSYFNRFFKKYTGVTPDDFRATV